MNEKKAALFLDFTLHVKMSNKNIQFLKFEAPLF